MSRLINIFRKKLDQREFDLKEEYWKDLEKQLDIQVPKASSNSSWFVASAGLFLVIALSTWYFYMNDEKIDQEKPASSSVNVLKPDGEKLGDSKLDKSLKHEEKEETHILTSEVLATGSEIAKGKDSGYSLHNNNSIKQEAKALDLSSRSIDSDKMKTLAHEETSQPEKEFITHSIKNKISTLQTTVSTLEKSETEKLTSLESEKESEKINTNHTAEAKGKDQQNENESSVEINQIPKSPSVPFSGEKQLNEQNEKVNDMEIQEEGEQYFALMDISFPLFLKEDDEDKAVKEFNNPVFLKSRKLRGYAGLYSGLMFSEKILKAKSEMANEYIGRRHSEEHSAVTTNFGIDFGVQINRWSLSTGLNYHQQSELIDYRPEFYQWIKNTSSTWNLQDNSFWNYTSDSIEYTVSEGSWQTVQNPVTYWNSSIGGWDTQTVSITEYVVDTTYTAYVFKHDSSFVIDIDSTEIILTDSTKKLVNDATLKPAKSISKLSYIEIPLMAGYEFPLGRLTLSAGTGLGFGILTKVEANYIRDDISGTEILDMSQMNRMIFSWLLNAGMNYYITEKVSFRLIPMYRLNLSSVLAKEDLEQRYWNAGMNAGLRYRF